MDGVLVSREIEGRPALVWVPHAEKGDLLLDPAADGEVSYVGDVLALLNRLESMHASSLRSETAV
jgi:hypothetical protein